MKFIVRIILFLILIISQLKPQTFTNISQQAGVNVIDASHIAVGDINNDGYQDIYVAEDFFLASWVIDYLFLNNGDGTFREVYLESGLRRHRFNLHHVGFGDFDNDGDQDLFIGNDTMYINNSNGTFIPKKVIDGLNFPYDVLRGNFPIDINNDGLLDIVSSFYRPNVGDSLFLLINKGNISFERINIQKFNVPTKYRIVWSDLNSDAKADLVLWLYDRSLEKYFLEFYIQTAPMTFIPLTSAGRFPKGSIEFGDIDNDGHLDFAITSAYSFSVPSDSGNMKLYKNNRDGTFTDISISSDFYARKRIDYGGPVMGDFNHDGYLDIYIAQNTMDDYLFINNQNGTFTNILADSSNMAYGGWAVILDFDRDGDLDLYVSNEMGSPFSSGENFLYRNNLSDNYNGTNNSIILELAGIISNRYAIGTRVECYSLSGSKYLRQTRYLGLQTGGQNMLPAHFGVGSSNIIDSLIVYWPSGIKQIVYNLPVHQYITITEDTTLTNVKSEDLLTELQYVLSQNYPNPFNPTTKIKYSIEDKGLVTLKVYDLLGREVTTLVNEQKQAGEYEIEFDATKYDLTSGVYFYQLRSGNYTSVKKFILMK